ncbi:predicted protein [Postia placenta Mad-698-R]|nr:predicted protein [Postia placenta Mad-698-R]
MNLPPRLASLSTPYFPVRGHVGRVNSRVQEPFQAFFGYNQSRASGLKSSSTLGGPRHRPCVIMEVSPGGEAEICLMVTWDGQPTSQLPLVYQHFSVVVNQTDDDHADGVVHTTPRWYAKNRQPQFLITLSFVPIHKVIGRWPGRDGVVHSVTREQRTRIRHFRSVHMRTWSECGQQDPGFQAAQQLEWEKSGALTGPGMASGTQKPQEEMFQTLQSSRYRQDIQQQSTPQGQQPQMLPYHMPPGPQMLPYHIPPGPQMLPYHMPPGPQMLPYHMPPGLQVASSSPIVSNLPQHYVYTNAYGSDITVPQPDPTQGQPPHEHDTSTRSESQ